MRFLWWLIKRGLFLLLIVVMGLAAPIAWNEVNCRGARLDSSYAALLPPDQHRPESRTLMTYPEWHIVHAYEDYAAVIATGAPQDYDYVSAIWDYWSSLCSLTEKAAEHGGADLATREMVYVIGVSFTAELLAKAAYEETIGRLFVYLRGDARAPLDDLSAVQAKSYAAFLAQVPWYKWDFAADRAALAAGKTDVLRDQERAIALGIEYGVKGQYARLIGAAVAATGNDALRMRVIVTGMTAEALAASTDVKVIGARPEGIEVDTPRYAAFTVLARDWAAKGAQFVEIAGNDDIMFTALSEQAQMPGALASYPRQGSTDTRHLMLVKVGDLAAALTDPALSVEHIHDY